ncbi:hypothetical protein M5C72_07205 [Companilactobacillus allii]|uniref:Transposase n=1 Tax=Companilactobacillus allii TaxID=1847728 RepID=A0A1P8Q4Y0_9LACO|nr:hypothetical protein [Companilactobacillus allii]APX72885.1 hypothetical protein BTM29_10120 [Companilactobacillus allii]USQ67673.1 hypothetical protein M5C72_07205 [Companilactobacillus allii]
MEIPSEINQLIDDAIEVGFLQAVMEFQVNPNNNMKYQNNLREANIKMMAQKKTLTTAIAKGQTKVKAKDFN